MIRSSRIPLTPLQNWLPQAQLPPHPQGYRLRVWQEDGSNFAPLRQQAIDYVQEALDDARMKLRAGFADDLSPFKGTPADPAANYPALLHRVTLQGYLGETLAGLAVEHFGAFGHEDWHIPAFLFRFHTTEFQHLDVIDAKLITGGTHDPDVDDEKRPGRTGDDALAFRIDAQGQISDVLTMEAKCLTKHSSGIVKKAHAQLSKGAARPSGVRELINLLADYSTPAAQEWRRRLLAFQAEGFLTANRLDGVAYAIGNRPKQAVAWLPADAPHEAYKGKRPLEAMEFQFDDVKKLVDILYRGK